MICIHHNKDLDGFSSGAIVKAKYPHAKLIGWDYKDPIPDFEQFKGEDIIMIDISFPMDKMNELAKVANTVIWIDHHISARKDYETAINSDNTDMLGAIVYIYELGVAACEIGWKHLFPDTETPYAITLLGRYDTWRQTEGDWENQTLPFQYYMRTVCTSPETFPSFLFDAREDHYMYWIVECVSSGIAILKYQKEQDRLACQRSGFKRLVYNGLHGVCLNTRAFSSSTVESIYDDNTDDIMIGFEYTGTKWSISLRSIGDKVDCSLIAKERGGGGHKNAAGFECDNFEDIFK